MVDIRCAWLRVLLFCALLPMDARAQEAWVLADRPDLVVGTADGAPETVFHGVVGAMIAADGSLVVADASLGRIRVFTSAGSFVTEFGRRGDGPREFRSLAWIGDCGTGQVVAYDASRYRITKWALDGSLIDEFPIQGPDPDRPPYSVSCSDDGRFAVVGWPDVVARPREVGPYRVNASVGVVDSIGQLERVVGSFPGPERYRYSMNDGPRPLGRTTTVQLGPDGVYLGTADTYEITVFARSGDRRTFGRDVAPIRMTPDLVRAWHDEVVGAMSVDRRADALRGIRDHQHPQTLPVFSTFRLDARGQVWVSRFRAPGQQTRELDVFDRHGVHRATLTVPRAFRLTDSGPDFVLGVWTDDLGVQQVRRYRIVHR